MYRLHPRWVLSALPPRFDQLHRFKKRYDRHLKDHVPFYDFPFLSLFYYLWHRHSGDERDLALAISLRDKTCARALKLNESPNIFASFLADHLVAGIWRSEIAQGAPLYEDHLDHFVLKAQKWVEAQVESPVELLNGVVGGGVLGLQLQNEALVSRVLDRVADHFRRSARERNLGVAHGLAGILLFLIYAKQRGFHSVELESNVERIVAEILDVERQTRGEGLPSVWPAPATTGPRPQTSWCNGDAGVGFALALYARVYRCSVPHHEIFERGTRPVSLPDIGLCHGLGGMVQLCKRYAEVTNHPDILARQKQWESLLIADTSTDRDVSLQYGDLGSALELLSQEVDVDLGWDRVFLLSNPWGMKHGFHP